MRAENTSFPTLGSVLVVCCRAPWSACCRAPLISVSPERASERRSDRGRARNQSAGPRAGRKCERVGAHRVLSRRWKCAPTTASTATAPPPPSCQTLLEPQRCLNDWQLRGPGGFESFRLVPPQTVENAQVPVLALRISTSISTAGPVRAGRPHISYGISRSLI